MRMVLLALCAYLLVVRAPISVVVPVAALTISPLLGIAFGAGAMGASSWRARKDAKEASSPAELFRDLASRMASGATLRTALVNTRSPLVSESAKRRAVVGQDASRIAEDVQDALGASGAEFASVLALSELVGASTKTTVEDLAERSTAEDARRRRQRVATAQARFSALIVGVAPLVVAIGIVAVRGVPEPGGAWVVGPMVVGAALMIVGTAVVLLGARRVSTVVMATGADGAQATAISSTALGVGAGLSFVQAASLAADHADPEVAARIRRSLRRAFASGSLDGAAGDVKDPIGRMFRVASHAEETGAPLRTALDALVREVQSERDTNTEERLARLPVKLVIPLALMILPGFVLLAVGPAVVGGLSRLSM